VRCAKPIMLCRAASEKWHTTAPDGNQAHVRVGSPTAVGGFPCNVRSCPNKRTLHFRNIVLLGREPTWALARAERDEHMCDKLVEENGRLKLQLARLRFKGRWTSGGGIPAPSLSA